MDVRGGNEKISCSPYFSFFAGEQGSPPIPSHFFILPFLPLDPPPPPPLRFARLPPSFPLPPPTRNCFYVRRRGRERKEDIEPPPPPFPSWSPARRRVGPKEGAEILLQIPQGGQNEHNAIIGTGEERNAVSGSPDGLIYLAFLPLFPFPRYISGYWCCILAWAWACLLAFTLWGGLQPWPREGEARSPTFLPFSFSPPLHLLALPAGGKQCIKGRRKNGCRFWAGPYNTVCHIRWVGKKKANGFFCENEPEVYSSVCAKWQKGERPTFPS